MEDCNLHFQVSLATECRRRLTHACIDTYIQTYIQCLLTCFHTQILHA